MSETKPVRVLVWDEAPRHAPKEIYPKSINGAIADGLNDGSGDIVAVPVNLDDPSQGITEEALANADVLIWWGHARHHEVSDETVAKVVKAVHKAGLGFIPLHSAHFSKPFKAVLDCTGNLYGGWRDQEPTDTEEIVVCAPNHPIAKGITNFTIEREEMYGAPFGVPPPEVVVFQSYFPLGGQYFPSFATTIGEGIDPAFTCGGGGGSNRGHGVGRVFYFRPGHETYPTYFNPTIRQIMRNAVLWTGKRT